METIEERAKNYAPNKEYFQECYKDACYEQRNIDIENAKRFVCEKCFIRTRCLCKGTSSDTIACSQINQLVKAMNE